MSCALFIERAKSNKTAIALGVFKSSLSAVRNLIRSSFTGRGSPDGDTSCNIAAARNRSAPVEAASRASDV